MTLFKWTRLETTKYNSRVFSHTVALSLSLEFQQLIVFGLVTLDDLLVGPKFYATPFNTTYVHFDTSGFFLLQQVFSVSPLHSFIRYIFYYLIIYLLLQTIPYYIFYFWT
jgi:hypothetical protein